MNYLYLFGFPPDEEALYQLEQRMLFGEDYHDGANFIVSTEKVVTNRSPFIRARVEIAIATTSMDELLAFASDYSLGEQTFKVVCLNKKSIGSEPKMTSLKRRELEMMIGSVIGGEPELNHPEREIAIVKIGDTYYFGDVEYGELVWQQHIDRPVQYSTALSAKHARALVNITAPKLEEVRIIDPCCGVGTVVIEALSMGANIVGRDMNWLVTSGSRQNIEHFGYEGIIELGPIEEVIETYDCAIIDMPYNLFTHSTDGNKQSIIASARRIAKRVVFVSSEDLRTDIEAEGFTIQDGCQIKKQQFVRNVYVCYG